MNRRLNLLLIGMALLAAVGRTRLAIAASDVRDFGFQNLNDNGQLALGHRPLLLVVVEFFGASPLAHTAAWYDSFFLIWRRPSKP